ncbi:MAG: T9SS type B sorting domain-containing protein [Saprospiraceae bacterium]
MARFQHCLILLLVVLSVIPDAKAQGCGCVNCPLPIRANQTDYELCYDVFNVFNNNLADGGQGVCNISIGFRHASVKNLEISLRSPGNQAIQLIGEFNPVGLTTNIGTTFDVSFVPSNVIPTPDAGHAERWTNTDFDQAGVNYTGTYHPFDDDLEDFNFGAVNGQWCLVITNHGAPITGFDGQIETFNIEFCDETGRDCCFANAGELSIADFAACSGSAELNLANLEPTYPFSEPDPASYDYSYVIAQGGNIINNIVSLPPDLSDPTDFPNGNFTICGLSHEIGANLAPTSSDPDQPYGLRTIADVRNDLNSPTAPFCGDLSDDCLEIFIQSPPEPVNLTPIICPGETYPVGDSIFNEAIVTTIMLQTVAGCDSIINLDLSFSQNDTTRITETICVDQTYFVGTFEFDSTDLYNVQLENQDFCDSVIILNLTVLEELETTLNERVCRGEPYIQGDSTYIRTGSYTNMFTSVNGCDSMVFLNLVVDTIDVQIATPPTLTCRNNIVTLDATASDNSTDYIYEWEVVGTTGNITGTNDQRTVQVDQAGTYQLTITDTALNNCFVSATVTVSDNLSEPTAIIEEAGVLNCAVNQTQLQGNNSTGQGSLSYEWRTTDGNIVGLNNQPTITISQPGTYELIVTDAINGCTNSETIDIIANDDLPTATASVSDSLTCARTEVLLSGAGSDAAADITYEWSTADGNILADATTLNPRVDAIGTYTLTVTNTVNGCSSTDDVRVGSQLAEPSISVATITEQISCRINSIQLDASASDQGTNFAVSWTTTNGNIVAGTESRLTPLVTAAGDYQLTIINQLTGCQKDTTVIVNENFVKPTAIAGNPSSEQITCRQDSIRLDGAASSAANPLNYFWEDEDANQLGNETNVFVKAGGLYFLIIEDTLNGCRDTASVAVTENFTPPMVEAGADMELNCAQPIRSLDGSASATGAEFSYFWDGPGIVSGTATIAPEINAIGTYYLTVLNDQTGCTSMDSVMVTLDNNLPMVDAGLSDTLTCNEPTLQLNANASTGANITYEWTSLENQSIDDVNTLTPTISNAGRYVLAVTNSANECIVTDTIIIAEQLELPNVLAGSDGLIDCNNNIFSPETVGSSNTSEFSFNWTTTDGNISTGLSTLTPVFDASGSYILEITNNNTGCRATDTLSVTANFSTPTASVDPVENLTCQENERVLDGSNSTADNPITYQWRTIDGNFAAATDVAQTTIDEPGNYTLIITDTVSGCVDSTTVEVNADDDLPTAITLMQTAIDCASGEVTLSGNGSSTGANITYDWRTTDGRFATTADPVVVIAQAAGTYTLVVTNTDNNCTAQSEVIVTQNCTPDAVVSTNDTITCFEQMAVISSFGSSEGNNFVLSWLDSLGVVIGMDDTLQVNRGGLYILEITSSVSGEVDRDSIIVVADQTPPTVDAGMDLILNCNTPTVQLNGINSSTGDNFQFVWTSLSNGFISDDSLTLTPTVNAGGIYDLEIINTENGCRAVDAVQVQADATLLEVCLNTAANFVCGQNELTIDATCSTQNANTVYTWTTIDGNIISGANSLQPTVSLAGIYTLTIEDTANGCDITEEVEVTEPNCDFSIQVSPDTSINCSRSTVTLTGQINPAGDNYTISWLNSNNEIIGQDTSVVVNVGDTYTFRVLELQTGVADSLDILVVADTLAPIVNAGQDVQLDCQTDTLRLSAISNVIDPIYQWTALNGEAIENPDTLEIAVIETGQYIVEVTNPANGCVATDTIAVTSNTDVPTAFAGSDTTFTCRDATLRLSGEGSTTGNDLRYNWTIVGTDGDICGQANTLNPTICAAGVYQLEVINDATGCISVDTIAVANNFASPEISAGDGTTLTCTDTTFNLNGNGPVGDNIELLWRFENGDTITTDTYTPTVNQAGEYFLVVNDLNNGCSSVAQTIIRIDTIPPAIDAGDLQTITCEDNSANLNGLIENGIRPYDIQWAGMEMDSIENDTLLNPTVYQSGMYTLTVLDEINGCVAQDSARVILDDDVPDVFAGEDQSLDCENEQFTLNGTSTADNIVFQWQDTMGTVLANQANLTVTQAGIYNLIALDTINNCAVLDEVVIAENRVDPEVVIQTLNTELDCTNSETTLRVESENINVDYDYQWTLFGSNTIIGIGDSLLVNTAGEYQLTAIDENNGCTTILTQTIQSNADLPQINIEPSSNFDCQTDSIQLVATTSDPTLDVLWTNEMGDTIATALTTTIFTAGEYNFTAINSASGCRANTSVQIEDISELPTVQINSNTTQLTCLNNEIRLTSTTSMALDYEWSDAQGAIVGLDRNLTINSPGQYILTVTNPETSCVNQDSITILAENAFINGFDIALTEPVCFGEGRGSVIVNQLIGGTEPFNYSLNQAPFISFPQFDFLEPNTYTLTVEDAFGCQRDTTFTIDQGRSVVVDLGGDQTIQLGENVIIEAQINDEIQLLEWDTNDTLECADCPTQTFNPLETTTYGVTVMNTVGCMATDEVTVQVMKDRPLYFPTAFSPNSDDSNEIFYIGAGRDVEIVEEMNIYDRWGTLMFSAQAFPPNDPTYGWDGRFAGKELNPAVFVYYARIRFKDGFVKMITGDIALIK